MRTILLTAGFSLACWSLFAYLFHKDRSRYRNCYALFLAIFSLFPLVVNLFGSAGRIAVLFIVYPILLSILIVPFFLIYNGIVMMKREGRSLPQLLSLLLGLIILAGEAVFIAGIVRVITTDEVQPLLIPKAFLPVTLAVFCVSVIYGSVSFLIFMIYTLFLQIIPRKKDFDYVIIHGAGLLDGSRVSKLLRDRLDKAVEVYRQDPSPPWLIPSGGQGPDETVPEAEAMKGYLLTQGIPEKDILPESESTTTMENLLFSKRILDSREGRKYTALVTSNYHVYRALRCARDIGLQCTGIGSHVAFYYWPSALIREYIAIHAEKKHAILFLTGWIACIGVLLYSIFQ